MLNKYEPPLCLNPKPSEGLNRILIVARLLALVACLANALPLEVQAALFVITYFYFEAVIKRLNNQHYAIQYSTASGWEFSTCGGDFEKVQVLASSVVTKYALFLHIESRQNSLNKIALKSATKKTALILADTLSEDEYRCLIVKLITTAIKQEQTDGSVDRIKPLK